MANAIERYLNDEITSSRLDKELNAIADATVDRTVWHVCSTMWLFYDDLVDHKVVATKDEWNHFHRLLLLLKSHASLELAGHLRWSIRQLIALAGLALFAGAVIRWGFGVHLVLVTVPLGAVSMLLSYWRTRVERPLVQACAPLTPFASVSDLLRTRRAVPGFLKRRYPDALGERRIRGRTEETLKTVLAFVSWLVVSPVALAVAALPDDDCVLRVVTPVVGADRRPSCI